MANHAVIQALLKMAVVPFGMMKSRLAPSLSFSLPTLSSLLFPFFVKCPDHITILSLSLSPSQYLSDIQEHLGVTIPEVDNTFDVPINEFDGKITYGEKRGSGGSGGFKYHTEQLAPSVELLTKMEKQAQSNFLHFQFSKSCFT